MGADPAAFGRARIAEDWAVALACREWLETLRDAEPHDPGPGLTVVSTAGEAGERTVRLPLRLREADRPFVDFLVLVDVERILLDLSAVEALVADHESTEGGDGGGLCRTCVNPDPSLLRPTPLRYPCPTLRAGLWRWSGKPAHPDYDPSWDSLEP